MAFIILSGLLFSCDICNDCGPLLDDPYFSLEFYARETKQQINIRFDTLNNLPASELNASLQRQASLFRLPLSPVDDFSSFDMVFTEFSPVFDDTVRFKRNLQISYVRKEVESNGIISIEASQFQIIGHDFDSIAPLSFDPSILSNELRIQVYL